MFFVRSKIRLVTGGSAKAHSKRCHGVCVERQFDVLDQLTQGLLGPVAPILVTHDHNLLPQLFILLKLAEDAPVQRGPEPGRIADLLSVRPQALDRGCRVIADFYGWAVEAEFEIPDSAMRLGSINVPFTQLAALYRLAVPLRER